MKRLVVGLVIGVMLGAAGAFASDAFSTAGRLGATGQEAQEGYFAIDQQTMVVVKPNTPLHNYLRRKVGQRVRLTVEPADGSDQPSE